VTELDSRIAALQERIERVLDACLALREPGTARLREAMRYSVLGGGKRLRPVLVYVTGEAFGASLEALDVPAAAVELVHVYSLVHDDLPSMDDDDLRRGRPTCHKAFDEATAILVGDALQVLAFDVLAYGTCDGGAIPTSSTSEQRLAMIRILARAIGTGGMAGGQAIDLEAVGQRLEVPALENMHRRKTGALIEASVLLGATAAGVVAPGQLSALATFGAEIGLAFQIQDDILDVEGDAGLLGKSTGADAAHAKPTYPSTLGLNEAHRHARAHCNAALAALAPLGPQSEPLATLARFVVDRVQ
jgi:geranylgeranyl diphosphate synthase, type II